MIDRLTLLFSVCALAVSVTALMSDGSSSGHALAKASASAKAPSEGLQKDPELDAKCAVDSGAAADLAELMKGRMNGALTRIAFSLHHDRGELGERMETAAACASNMVQSAHLASSYRPDAPLERLSEYYGQLDQLQGHAFAVKTAALEGNLDEARHWFAHLKQSCIRCHDRFRIE